MNTSLEYQIRAISASDYSSWCQLWQDYLEFYQTTLDQSIYETTFARLLDDSNVWQHAYIAELDEVQIGLVHFIIHPHNWKTEPVCYLQDLFVTESHRGKGVARALMMKVFQSSDARGCVDVYWLTQESNSIARRLYDRIGVKAPFLIYHRSDQA